MEDMMKNKSIFRGLFFVIGLFFLAQFLTQGTHQINAFQTADDFQPESNFLFPDMGCTVIYASDGEIALGGNNEDYIIPFTQAWFLPPEDGKFGRVYFGFEGFLWGGGMNDQGLFFDALGVDQPIKVSLEGKTRHYGSLPGKALEECADIDCVVDIFSNNYSLDTWYHQFMFGDAYGNSVIVEANTFLHNEKSYQVATNFYQSITAPATCHSCDRYHNAMNLFASTGEYSVDLIRDILDAVHSESGSPTLYSTVYDLKDRVVYLYHYHDFENVFIFQLDEELAKGYHAYTLADLFPPNQAYLDWAKQELDYVASLRAAYQPIQVDPEIYVAYIGDYDIPSELGLPYPFYRIDILNDSLFLKIKTDKGWLELFPLSETDFYHVSSFAQFEVTFLKDENGEVNQFLYTENGEEYTFNRITEDDLEPATPSPSPTATLIPTPISTSSSTEVHQTSPVTLEESPFIVANWWLIPGAAVIIFAVWKLFRRTNNR
jgi:hypothetical protein